MTIKTDLQAVRAILAKGWTQGAYARNHRGEVVRVDDPNASCWCLYGAFKTLGAVSNWPAYHFMETNMDIPPVVFNDDPHRTQAEMLSLLDTLIETAP